MNIVSQCKHGSAAHIKQFIILFDNKPNNYQNNSLPFFYSKLLKVAT